MALNYPRIEHASGVWNMKEVTDAVKGGYWPNALSRAWNKVPVSASIRIETKTNDNSKNARYDE